MISCSLRIVTLIVTTIIALTDAPRSQNVSIGDLDMQLDFLIKELKSDYPAVWTCLCSASSVKIASDTVMCQFERPADTSGSAKNKRYEYSQKYYNLLAASSEREVMKMTKYGIDVSVYNGAVDWTKVKASGKADFAILRAGILTPSAKKKSVWKQIYSLKCSKENNSLIRYILILKNRISSLSEKQNVPLLLRHL